MSDETDDVLATIATAAAEVDEERVHAGVPAEMGVRVMARLIDWMLVAVSIVLAIIVHQFLPREHHSAAEPWLVGAVWTFIVTMCLMEVTPGGSPGKRFSGIRLLTHEGYTPLIGRRAGRLALRNGGLLVLAIGLPLRELISQDWADVITPVISLAGLFHAAMLFLDWLWLTTTGRTLHDVLTRTIVGDVGSKLQRKRGFEVLAR